MYTDTHRWTPCNAMEKNDPLPRTCSTKKESHTLDACTRPPKQTDPQQKKKILPFFVRIGLGKIFTNGRDQPAYVGVVAIDGTFQQRRVHHTFTHPHRHRYVPVEQYRRGPCQ